MTTFQSNNEIWCAVSVPAEATEISIVRNILLNPQSLKYKIATGDNSWTSQYVGLPSNVRWEIFADTETVTEEQAAQMVDKYKGDEYKFAYYENGVQLPGYWCEEALKSLSSLLRSHSLNGRTIILKKKKD